MVCQRCARVGYHSPIFAVSRTRNDNDDTIQIYQWDRNHLPAWYICMYIYIYVCVLPMKPLLLPVDRRHLGAFRYEFQKMLGGPKTPSPPPPLCRTTCFRKRRSWPREHTGKVLEDAQAEGDVLPEQPGVDVRTEPTGRHLISYTDGNTQNKKNVHTHRTQKKTRGKRTAGRTQTRWLKTRDKRKRKKTRDETRRKYTESGSWNKTKNNQGI